MGLTRFGVSLDNDLLKQFDDRILRNGQKNRSEAIRDLIRDALVRHCWEKEAGDKAGTITIIYDHHKSDVSERLNKIEHDNHDCIISKMHIHLDHDNCLEVLAVKGKAEKIHEIADEIIGTKGVKHGKLTATSTGKHLK
jgi:CopG family transcriptional regulator, nickel-responsive regulator